MFTIARFEVLLITQTKVFVKHTTLIDKCKNKRKKCESISIVESKKLIKQVKTILE